MFEVGQKVINTSTGGTATITEIYHDTWGWDDFVASMPIYTLKGNRLGNEIKIPEDKLIGFFDSGRLELWTEELKPKRYNLKFNFIDSW